jgi:hypothetical protein
MQKFSTQLCNYPLSMLPALVFWENFMESEHQMRAVRKVSVDSECLVNWSSGLDVTWQPVQGDLTVHP